MRNCPGSAGSSSASYVTVRSPTSGWAGDELYVPSAHGPNNPWFRRAKASGAGRIRAGGLERDVTFAEPAPSVHTGIDAAYHAKYERFGPEIVGTVVGPQAAAVTIRLVPGNEADIASITGRE